MPPSYVCWLEASKELLGPSGVTPSAYWAESPLRHAWSAPVLAGGAGTGQGPPRVRVHRPSGPPSPAQAAEGAQAEGSAESKATALNQEVLLLQVKSHTRVHVCTKCTETRGGAPGSYVW